MNFFGTHIYLDREISPQRLAAAFARAYDVPADQVHVATRDEFEQGTWRRLDDAQVDLVTDRVDGDFPTAIDWISRTAPNLRDTLIALAADLNVAIVTDEIDVEPLGDDWFFVGPDGRTAIVRGDPEAYPAIVLEPGSRAAYDAIHRQAAVHS